MSIFFGGERIVTSGFLSPFLLSASLCQREWKRLPYLRFIQAGKRFLDKVTFAALTPPRKTS